MCAERTASVLIMWVLVLMNFAIFLTSFLSLWTIVLYYTFRRLSSTFWKKINKYFNIDFRAKTVPSCQLVITNYPSHKTETPCFRMVPPERKGMKKTNYQKGFGSAPSILCGRAHAWLCHQRHLCPTYLLHGWPSYGLLGVSRTLRFAVLRRVGSIPRGQEESLLFLLTSREFLYGGLFPLDIISIT